jgi:hypothetical protein
MLTFYDKYKGGEYSQNGEASVINEILRRLKIKKGLAIEFGAPTKQYCSNIYHLPEEFNKMYFDIQPQEPGIIKAEILPGNISSFIPSCQVLSIDVDGIDYELIKAWKNRADVLVIEINSSIAPTVDFYSRFEGASYRSMCKMLADCGYFVICHTGNLIAVDAKYRKLFKEIPDDPVEQYSLFFQTRWLK